MSERAAIFMVRRDETGQLHVIDGRGEDRIVASDAHLREILEAVLDDPNMPQAEQVAQVEYAVEQVLVQAAAAFLPEVARPLAAPLVRDMSQILRKVATQIPTKIQRTVSEPVRQRQARARASRIRASRQRVRGRGAA